MAAFSWVIGHGGVYGMLAESALALLVVALVAGVWLREKRRQRRRGRRSAAEMRE